MISDGTVYAAGGTPALALWHYDGCCRISIVGTGMNRKIVDPGKPLPFDVTPSGHRPSLPFYTTAAAAS